MCYELSICKFLSNANFKGYAAELDAEFSSGLLKKPLVTKSLPLKMAIEIIDLPMKTSVCFSIVVLVFRIEVTLHIQSHGDQRPHGREGVFSSVVKRSIDKTLHRFCT